MATQTPAQRRATAKKAAATRKRNSTAGQRSTAGKKAAATRKRNASADSARSAQASAENTASSAARAVETGVEAGAFTIEALAQQAERAVLIPVGAALLARDNVVEAAKPYTRRASAERELGKLKRQLSRDLNRFERRGATARNRLERKLKRQAKGVGRGVERQVGAVQDNLSQALP